MYQRTQGSKTSRIVVTETADYWCLVEHETAGSAVSNIAEIEFQPPAAFLTFTRKVLVNNDTSNLVTERINISEYDDGVTLYPSKAEPVQKLTDLPALRIKSVNIMERQKLELFPRNLT